MIKFYIRLYRLKRKMSTKILSELSGVPQETIKDLESGKRKDVSLPYILSIAKVLNVDFELLFKYCERT